MPRPAPAHKSFADRNSLYQQITDKIIGHLEQGRVPWVQPWANTAAPLGLPKNAATGRAYSGVNVLILWIAGMERGFGTQRWLTFRQALKIGAHVLKGEKGTTVVYADRFIPYRERTRAQETGDDPQAIPFLKSFTVFNADQCADLPDDIVPPPAPATDHLILPQAEALIRATGADIRIGGNQAFYIPSADYIRVPPPSAYFEPINWHRTVCHELGHWSGAAHRLNRDMTGVHGSPSYAREELVAEMCGAFVCAALSIVPTVRHADYLGNWLEVLREDNRAIIRAASAASKAADYLLAFRDRELGGEDPVAPAPGSSPGQAIFLQPDASLAAAAQP
jgi:antirestriction protein ArdC